MDIKKLSKNLPKCWQSALQAEFTKPYFKSLQAYINNQYTEQTVYPPRHLIFNAFACTPLNATKAVILGQDPYHGPGQAHGLAFSVQNGVQLPPSLRNIYKELLADVNVPTPLFGDLTPWAKQGVLLLNATLTVRQAEAGSHQNQGWEIFTDEVIRQMSERKNGLVFILWGSYAQKKINLIDTQKHHVIQSAHPSPLSAYRGFFGSKPFSKTNQLLLQMGKNPIDWQLM